MRLCCGPTSDPVAPYWFHTYHNITKVESIPLNSTYFDEIFGGRSLRLDFPYAIKIRVAP